MSGPDRTKAPAVQPLSQLTLVHGHEEVLPSGIVFHSLSAGDQDISRLVLVWESGGLDFPVRSLGRFVAEGLREGSRHYSGEHIADAVDFSGARLQPHVSEHYTGLELIALNSLMPGLLPMLRDMVTQPLYSDSTVEMTARRLAAAQLTARAKVSYIASTALARMLRGEGHPAAADETPEDILAIRRGDVVCAHALSIGRGRLHAFLSGYLTEKLCAEVRAFLADLPGPSAPSAIKIVPDAPSAPSRRDIVVDGAVQTAIAMGTPAIPRSHPDYIALRLAVIGLGGYFSSRLTSNIREEKGLTYGISSYLLGSHEGSSVRVGVQCEGDRVDEVICETRREMARLVTEPIDGDELERLRLYAWTSLAATCDSPFAMSDYYLTRLEVGTGEDYFRRQLHEIQNLTASRLAEVAVRHLHPELLSVAVAGQSR